MSGGERIILAGGGGFCRELIFWVEETSAAGKCARLGGYLDDAGESLAGLDYPQVPFLGTIDEYTPRPGDTFLIAIGTPRIKRRVFEKLHDRGGCFARLVHPTSRVLRTASLGEGVIFCPGAAAGPDTIIERFVTFNAVCGAGHDARVGEFSTISSNTDITGGVTIGANVMVGSGVTFLPGVTVGDGATIGAGSVVYRSVKGGSTVFSAPAKTLKITRQDEAGGSA